MNISANNIRLSLSVDLSINKKDSNSFFDLHSRLSLFFESPQNIYDITKWYRTILQSFQFLSNRQDIEFETVTIGNKENIKLAMVYIANKDKTFEISHKDRRFVEYYHIKDNIGELLNIMFDKKINMYHLPANDRDHYILTPEKLVFTSSSFEYEFDLLNKENILIDNPDLLFVQDRLYKELEKINIEFKGKNKGIRKLAKSLKDNISKYNKALENKIAMVLEGNQTLLEYIVNKLSIKFDIPPTPIEVGETFALARNKNAHGNLTNYSNKEIASFMVVRALVYAMIMKRCFTNDQKIMEIIKIHF